MLYMDSLDMSNGNKTFGSHQILIGSRRDSYFLAYYYLDRYNWP